MIDIKCRTAPSLGGGFEGTPESAWGLGEYNPRKDINKPCLFFGLYDLRDFYALWHHKGKRYVLWGGSDIRNLESGFVFNDGKLKTISKLFGGLPNFYMDFLRNDVEHWVEDEWEQSVLNKFSIKSRICPSFLGNVDDFPISYKDNDVPHIYLSASSGKERDYGFDFIEEEIAPKLAGKAIFHLYGVDYPTYNNNVVVEGRVDIKKMNHDIKKFQCGLRLNKTDGFSEITAKSVLMGQYPITRLKYPMIPNFNTAEELIDLLLALKEMYSPNYVARDYYLLHLNCFPFNLKKYGTNL